jgi:Flp pilus assembly protein TadD
MTPALVRLTLVVVAVLLVGITLLTAPDAPFWSAERPASEAAQDTADPYVRLRLSEEARQAGDHAGALAHARAAVMLAPQLPEARWTLAALLTGDGEFNEAFVHYDVAMHLDPEPSAQHLSNLALALTWSGRPKDAIPRYRQAIALTPNIAWIHENYAYALAVTGDVAGAKAELEEALRLDPSAPGPKEALAKLGAAPPSP